MAIRSGAEYAGHAEGFQVHEAIAPDPSLRAFVDRAQGIGADVGKAASEPARFQPEPKVQRERADFLMGLQKKRG